jgi:hypothetical protein
MTQNGLTPHLKEEIRVSRAMGRDGCTREDLVGIRMFGTEDLGCLVTVYEEGFTACLGGFETVEELEAGALPVVGCICVGGEGEWGVGCVGVFEITCKVPESAVVGGHDVRQLFDESLGCLGGMRHIVDERETNVILQVRSDELWRWYDILCPLSDSGPGGCRVHDFFVIYDRGVVRNLASPEGFAAMIRWGRGR